MLKMLRDRLLIKPIIRELSKIIIVDNTERYNIGEVIAAGPGKVINGKLIRTDVKVGDIVRYGEFDFPVYENEGTKYLIIQEADVAGIVEI